MARHRNPRRRGFQYRAQHRSRHENRILGVVWATAVELLLVFGLFVPWLIARTCPCGFVHFLCHLLRHAAPFVALGLIFHLFIGEWIVPDYLRIVLFGLAYGVISIPRSSSSPSRRRIAGGSFPVSTKGNRDRRQTENPPPRTTGAPSRQPSPVPNRHASGRDMPTQDSTESALTRRASFGNVPHMFRSLLLVSGSPDNSSQSPPGSAPAASKSPPPPLSSGVLSQGPFRSNRVAEFPVRIQ